MKNNLLTTPHKLAKVPNGLTNPGSTNRRAEQRPDPSSTVGKEQRQAQDANTEPNSSRSNVNRINSPRESKHRAWTRDIWRREQKEKHHGKTDNKPNKTQRPSQESKHNLSHKEIATHTSKGDERENRSKETKATSIKLKEYTITLDQTEGIREEEPQGATATREKRRAWVGNSKPGGIVLKTPQPEEREPWQTFKSLKQSCYWAPRRSKWGQDDGTEADEIKVTWPKRKSTVLERNHFQPETRITNNLESQQGPGERPPVEISNTNSPEDAT